jgi:hypothetical protein
MLDIHNAIECAPSEERVMNIGQDEMSAARKKVEEHIFNGVMRQLQVPMGSTYKLICWMSVG